MNPILLKKVCLLLFFSLSVLPLYALQFEVEQLAPEVITNLQLSQFDLEGSGLGPAIFRLKFDNMGDMTEYDDLELFYTLRITQNGVTSILYRGKTAIFSIPANSRVEVLSNDFLAEENGRTDIYLNYTLERISSNSLRTTILDEGRVPSGQLELSFELRGGSVDQVSPSHNIEIVYPQRVDLMYPGVSQSDNSSFNSVVNGQEILFQWNSDFAPYLYENCTMCRSKDVFELEIFEVSSFTDGGNFTGRVPLFTVRTETNSYLFDAAMELREGHTYLWRVKGLLQGLTEGEIVSSTYRFVYREGGEIAQSEMHRVLTSIFTLIGREDLARDFDSYEDVIPLSDDGRKLTLDELRVLEAELRSGMTEVHRIRVE